MFRYYVLSSPHRLIRYLVHIIPTPKYVPALFFDDNFDFLVCMKLYEMGTIGDMQHKGFVLSVQYGGCSK